MKSAFRVMMPLILAMSVAALLLGCQKAKAPKRPVKGYTAVQVQRLGFAGVDLLPYIGEPLEKAKQYFHSEINIDEEVGVAFIDVRGNPGIPTEWGLRPDDRKSSISFLCTGVPDRDFNYSYDMLIHEAGMSVRFSDAFSLESVEALLEHTLQAMQIQGATPRSLARAFMEGNNIHVALDVDGKGAISLSHSEDGFYFWMRITDQADFFG